MQSVALVYQHSGVVEHVSVTTLFYLFYGMVKQDHYYGGGGGNFTEYCDMDYSIGP